MRVDVFSSDSYSCDSKPFSELFGLPSVDGHLIVRPRLIAALRRDLHVPLCATKQHDGHSAASSDYHKESPTPRAPPDYADTLARMRAHDTSDQRTCNSKSSPVTWENFMKQRSRLEDHHRSSLGLHIYRARVDADLTNQPEQRFRVAISSEECRNKLFSASAARHPVFKRSAKHIIAEVDALGQKSQRVGGIAAAHPTLSSTPC